MAPTASDKSLLERLNALKPSSVTLAGDSQRKVSAAPVTAAASPASVLDVSLAAPAKREDGLALRLRSLREQTEPAAEAEAHTAVSSPPPDSTRDDEAEDPLTFGDEQALNDFLLDLAAQGIAEEDVESAEGEEDKDGFILLPDVPSGGDLARENEEDEDDSQQVADLLKSLGATPLKKKEGAAHEAKGQPTEGADEGADDSEGDDMGRAVDRVLAQAQSEADWERRQGVTPLDLDATAGTKDALGPRDVSRDKEEAAPNLDLDPDPDPDNPLHLPAVPTRLVDPLPSPQADAAAADDISARLAALRGLSGDDAGLGRTDAFGLPSAPTFAPGQATQAGLHGRAGFTDADQKSWCVVCLEDADVRCLGCDGDVYCARCWRDMHVGPAAGFDERGHRRVPLAPKQGGK